MARVVSACLRSSHGQCNTSLFDIEDECHANIVYRAEMRHSGHFQAT